MRRLDMTHSYAQPVPVANTRASPGLSAGEIYGTCEEAAAAKAKKTGENLQDSSNEMPKCGEKTTRTTLVHTTIHDASQNLAPPPKSEPGSEGRVRAIRTRQADMYAPESEHECGGEVSWPHYMVTWRGQHTGTRNPWHEELCVARHQRRWLGP